MIYWDKTGYTNADSFIVYRETFTNTYKRIGATAKEALSEFTDTVRWAYFPFTGNPNDGTFRYKLQVRDTCGNYSSLSNWHNTIYTTPTISGSSIIFNWNEYKIENQTSPLPNLGAYYLYRDNTSSGTWTIVTAVSGSQLTASDANYQLYPNARWRVEAQWNVACNLTRATVNTSRSNIKHQTSMVTGLNTLLSLQQTNVYPNPANDNVTVEFAPEIQKATVRIMNAIGQVVYETEVSGTGNEPLKTNINIANIDKGVYMMEIGGEKGKVIRKLVIN
jgi:hypothetical protein